MVTDDQFDQLPKETVTVGYENPYRFSPVAMTLSDTSAPERTSSSLCHDFYLSYTDDTRNPQNSLFCMRKIILRLPVFFLQGGEIPRQ